MCGVFDLGLATAQVQLSATLLLETAAKDPLFSPFGIFSVVECLVLFSTFSNRVVPFAEFYFGESYFLLVWDPSNASESVASVQGPQSLFLTAKNGVSLTVMQSTIGTWC